MDRPLRVITLGWDRAVHVTGAEAKQTKMQINQVWIYPPAADRDAAFAAADPSTYAAL